MQPEPTPCPDAPPAHAGDYCWICEPDGQTWWLADPAFVAALPVGEPY